MLPYVNTNNLCQNIFEKRTRLNNIGTDTLKYLTTAICPKFEKLVFKNQNKFTLKTMKTVKES